MIIYLANLLFAVFFSLVSIRRLNTYKRSNECELCYYQHRSLISIAFIIASFVFLFAFRWKVGTDFMNYYSGFWRFGKISLMHIFTSPSWGFYLLPAIIAKIFPNQYIIYAIILGLLIYIPNVLVIRKCSNHFTFSIALYIMTMSYYWPYNGTRQSLAGAIIFLALPFLNKNRLLIPSLLVIYAYFIHPTALVVLPFIFIARRRTYSLAIISTIVILLILNLFFRGIWVYIVNFLDTFGQNRLAASYNTLDNARSGANILRFIILALPPLLSLVFYKSLKRYNPNIDILINMSLFGFIIFLFSIRATVLARLSSYFTIYNILLIPEFCNIFRRRENLLVKITVCTCYLFQMIILLNVDSALLPFRFSFSL